MREALTLNEKEDKAAYQYESLSNNVDSFFLQASKISNLYVNFFRGGFLLMDYLNCR